MKAAGYVSMLSSIWVEMKCPQHGLERFQIKIVKKFNIKPDMIMPRFRSRPTKGDLSHLLVGRSVTNGQIEKYMLSYFRDKGLIEAILRIRLIG
jgi:hypothetical protein